MANAISTSLTALKANQIALATTSNNVANVNTEGYSRQRVHFNAQHAETSGLGAIGAGVDVSRIERQVNQFISTQMNQAQSTTASLRSFNEIASRASDFITDSEWGINQQLGSFVTSLNALSSQPESLAQRQLVLSDADQLVKGFHRLDKELDNIQQEVNTRLSYQIDEVNRLSEEIAKLNEAISTYHAQTPTSEPNDLLDQRDAALFKLNQSVSVSIIEQPNQSINVYVGNGQPVVLASQSYPLHIDQDPIDINRIEIFNSDNMPVKSTFVGGELGGMIKAESAVLDYLDESIGKMVINLHGQFNQQHHKGLSLDGLQGKDFFSVAQPSVISATTNRGNAIIGAEIFDHTQLETSEYRINHDGSLFTVIDNETGIVLGETDLSTPFEIGGIRYTLLEGAAMPNDSFSLNPINNAASSLKINLNDPSQIAASNVLTVTPVESNRGLVNLSPVTLTSANTGTIENEVNINFVDASHYQINDEDTLYEFQSGDTIEYDGWKVTINGDPEIGDRFVVEKNTQSIGDNNNLLAMASLMEQPISATEGSIQDSVDQTLATITNIARGSQNQLAMEQRFLEQKVSQHQSVSGVNLDEEAANLLKFQQAYEAAAQVMRVANGLFETILNIAR